MPNSLSKRREPFAFMLYMGIIGSVLAFLFIIGLFLKKEFKGQNIIVPLPQVFWLSTWTMIFSSFTLFWANRAFRNERFRTYRLNIGVTLLLGFLFIFLQSIGWQQLFSYKLIQQNDTGAAFVYALSGLHTFHALVGMVALGFVNIEAFRNMEYIDSYIYSVNPPNQLKMRLITIYWHFVNALWITIFLFIFYHASQNTGNSH